MQMYHFYKSIFCFPHDLGYNVRWYYMKIFFTTTAMAQGYNGVRELQIGVGDIGLRLLGNTKNLPHSARRLNDGLHKKQVRAAWMHRYDTCRWYDNSK